jgi:octaprenyl-diphosphate synthase
MNVSNVYDRSLERALRVAPQALRRVMGDLVGAGGKRLRPQLVLLAARAAGPKRRGVLRLAVAAEAVHSATLLHDDVIDVAHERRGKPSAPVVYGNAMAVLGGDWLFTLAMSLVARTGQTRIFDELLNAIRAMVEAEALQQAQLKCPELDEAVCLSIVTGKTASLFRWCAMAGAIAAGGSEAHVQALASYAGHVGVAFQLADDLDDLGSPEAIGEDLAQGYLTLPVLLACRAQPSLIKGDPRAVIEAVHSSGARAQVEAKVRAEYAAAARCLEVLPPSPAREALALAIHPEGGVTMSSSTLKLGKFVKFREEKFGGVLFETRQERVFSLNPTAAAVVKELLKGTDIVASLKEHFDDPNNELPAQVNELLESLEKQGLVVRA